MSTPPNQMRYSPGASLGATPTAPRKSWFSRNWKWFVPVILIVVFGLPLVVIGSVFAAMKNSDAVKESVLRAQANPLVVQKLGTPITEGWMVSGSINTSTTSGDADLAVPISGPKGQAKIYVTAHKAAGVWNYNVMEVAFEGSNERINLLSELTARGEFPTPPPVTPVQPAAQPPDQPVSSAPAMEPPSAPPVGVIQTQDTATSGVVAELTECRRKEGVLNIKVRFHNTSNKKTHMTILNGGDYVKFFFTAENKKYFILKDSEGTYLTPNAVGNYGMLEMDLGPGESYPWWAKYPAPPAEVKKISFYTPMTSPFDDVPITDQ